MSSDSERTFITPEKPKHYTKRGFIFIANYELMADEVILYEGVVTSKNYKGTLQLILTSQKIIFEKEKELFKKERELIDILPLETVKVYNDAAQIKQKVNTVEVQTVDKNIAIVFSGMLEARKFTGKMMDAVTGTTLAHRSSHKIKCHFLEWKSAETALSAKKRKIQSQFFKGLDLSLFDFSA